jgi:hypothetical protein
MLQLLCPFAPLNLPATHAVHISPSAPDQPALQVQLLILMLALGESEFVGQSLQLPAPAALFHFPCTHAVQPPSLPTVYPALQVQFVISMLAIGESE